MHMLAMGVLTLWPAWRILRRAGLDRRLALLVFLAEPGLLALVAILAITHWPVLPPPPPPPFRKARAG